MLYHHIPYVQTKNFCIQVFKGYGFTDEESARITDALRPARKKAARTPPDSIRY